MRDVDLLYIACNRLEFTKETFSTLILSTEWDLVRELTVIDDGSTDGTFEFLQEAIKRVSASHRLLQTKIGSPSGVTKYFFENSVAPILAKLDNDAMYPPGWLTASLDVLERHPELDLLGIEAFYEVVHEQVERHFEPAEFISGLGLYRRRTFERFGMFEPFAKWCGLEEWQQANPGIVRGWLRPSLPVFLLDRIPFNPWSKYSDQYVLKGWQRQWPKYAQDSDVVRWRWPEHAGNTRHVHPG